MKEFSKSLVLSFTQLLLVLFWTSAANAQLSQLEFENPGKKKPAAVEKTKVKSDLPGSIEEAERREKEAMEALLKAKNAEKVPAASVITVPKEVIEKAELSRAGYDGLEVSLDPYPREYRTIPPRVKGPKNDKGLPDLVSSSIKWESSKAADCSQAKGEGGYLQRSVALKNLLKKFSGSNDGYELLNAEVCSARCDSETESSMISQIRLAEGSNVRLLMPSEASKCWYQFERQPGTTWKLLQAQNVHCSCFSKDLVAGLKTLPKAMLPKPKKTKATKK